ncbi:MULTISPECIES: MarR family transcriptional regulator [unclassified Nonomuraea]|uniref:MarR family transcriptional regulator n=1 Tax=unclassified Nonomuraea TaxID=2593643 RepID=UPI003410CEEB
MPGGRLTQPERRRIAAGLAEGLSYSEIARGLRRPASTVTREIARNGGPSDYQPDRAHLATERRARRRKPGAPASARPSPTPAAAHGRDPEAVDGLARRLAALLVTTGLPEMMARVLACLYTTDSGSLTSAELVRRLRVSPASISKAVGYLEEQELIRREREPRQRRERYVCDNEVWYRALQASARVSAELADIAEQGAGVLGPATPGGVRLKDMSRIHGHISRDILQAAERWRHIPSGDRTADGDRTMEDAPGTGRPPAAEAGRGSS